MNGAAASSAGSGAPGAVLRDAVLHGVWEGARAHAVGDGLGGLLDQAAVVEEAVLGQDLQQRRVLGRMDRSMGGVAQR